MAKRTASKSRPQEALRIKLEELYPDSYVSEEEYIGDLIKERGYTIAEITRELGHKPHKMFVDIIMKDSDRIVAFEYHGEQHYSLVGNMTKTTADLMLNQQLDQEKSWILERIAIPLVAVPYDMYIDERVIEDLIEQAYVEMENGLSGMTDCPECDRLFPAAQLSNGVCEACWQKIYGAQQEEREQEEEEKASEWKARQLEYKERMAQKRKEEARKRREEKKQARKVQKELEKQQRNNDNFSQYDENYDDSYDGYSEPIDDYSEPTSYELAHEEYKQKQKEKAKALRKEAYKKYKESPQYQEQKERAKQMRKEAYQRQKEQRGKNR